MAKLIYSTLASLDGYVADNDGKFGWAEPDEEVHAFVNDLSRPVGTYLYGRGMYEVMLAWENLDVAGQPPAIQDYAEIWRAADKIVFSRTLEEVTSDRTRLEREFDPEVVRQLKEEAGQDLAVAGPELAARRSRQDSSTSTTCSSRRPSWAEASRCFPTTSGSTSSLLDERRFTSGFVFLSYTAR